MKIIRSRNKREGWYAGKHKGRHERDFWPNWSLEWKCPGRKFQWPADYWDNSDYF